MERDYVRDQLAKRVAATSVEQVARDVGVATMTLQRFVIGEVVQPRSPAWDRMVAAVVRPDGIGADEVRGVLTAVRRLRLALDQLEHEARAMVSAAPEGHAVHQILEAALPTPPTESAAPPASARKARRRAKG
jgi:hypothetical protein